MAADAELALLLDERAIVAVAVRYCWALDTREWDALDDVFLDDATAHLGETRDLHGLDAIKRRCRAALERLDESQHLVSTHQVYVDGDRATHRCYVHAQHTRRGVASGNNYVVGGRYEDELARTAGGWRIAHRTLAVMWTEGDRAVLLA